MLQAEASGIIGLAAKADAPSLCPQSTWNGWRFKEPSGTGQRVKQQGRAASWEEGKDEQWAQGRRASQGEETDQSALSPLSHLRPSPGRPLLQSFSFLCEQRNPEGSSCPKSPCRTTPQSPPQVSTNFIHPCPLPAPPILK